jgi:hypothetical protein
MFVLFAGCGLNAPEDWSDASALMVRYNKQGRHDHAIRIAQEWIKKHPDDHTHESLFYEQIALTYLEKASKDRSDSDKWIHQAVTYYDSDLAVYQKQPVDVELYEVGRGFEMAGDLSTNEKCLYYRRAVDAFVEEFQFIQGDSDTTYGKTIPLAPVRQENQRALERTKVKFKRADCK